MTIQEKQDSGTSKWLKIAIEVGIILFAVGLAWATLSNDVGDNEEDIKENKIKIEKVVDVQTAIVSDIRAIRLEQKHIADDVREIKDIVKGK